MVRKMRTAYSTIYESSALAVLHTWTFKGAHGNTFSVNHGSTDTWLFRKFMAGLEKRMGRLVLQNSGLSVELLLALLTAMEVEYERATLDYTHKRKLIMCGSAFMVLFSAALQRGEVLLGEALELLRRIAEGKHHLNHPHILFPLMGWFKGETGEHNLIFYLANVSNSRIPNRRWLERLVRLLRLEGRHREAGPAFCDPEGFVLSSSALNNELHHVLSNLQMSRPDLITHDIMVTKAYNVYRSFRQGATMQAWEAKVLKDIIEVNNRWSKVEKWWNTQNVYG